MPEKTRLLLLDGDKLELTCVCEHTGPSENLSFYTNDVLILNNTGGFILVRTSISLLTGIKAIKYFLDTFTRFIG